MEEAGFAAAAALALLTFAVHTFAGGVHVVRPLLAAADLPPAARWLSYYCWHIATLTILALAAVFAAAAVVPDVRPAALAAAVFAVLLSLLSAAVAVKAGIMPLRFPSTSLFAATAAAGFAGAYWP